MSYDWEFVKKTVKSYQKESRYLHTLGVSEEAKELGYIFLPEKVEKLYLTGLLHDITKDFDKTNQLELCKEFNVDVSDDIAPKLLHSKTGCVFAKRLFGEEYVDSEVYSAILYHTTGREKMTLFEILIYLADYIEKGRTFEDCVELRKYFYENIKNTRSYEEKLEVLRKTMVLSFDMTIKNLISEGKRIDKDTINARNYFLNYKLVQKEI